METGHGVARDARTVAARSIGWSILAHGVIALALASQSPDPPDLSAAPFIGLVLCQSSLLGIWCGLGRTSAAIRGLIFLLGTLYLFLVFGLGINELEKDIFMFIVASTGLVAATMLVLRWGQWVAFVQGPPPRADREGLQFTIRHLFEWTFVVSCLLAAGRFLAPTLPQIDTTARIIALALCYATVGVTSVWAALGTGHVVGRGLGVLAFAVAIGAVENLVILPGHALAFWILTTVVQAAATIASLLVVRRAGYRVLRIT